MGMKPTGTCKSIGCDNPVDMMTAADFCPLCESGSGGTPAISEQYTVRTMEARRLSPLGGKPKGESSGGDNDYWMREITHPKRLEPYVAECEDIIESLGMTFQEGEAFKAIWRKAALRLGFGKPGDSDKRNAEKIAHFGQRMVAMATQSSPA